MCNHLPNNTQLTHSQRTSFHVPFSWPLDRSRAPAGPLWRRHSPRSPQPLRNLQEVMVALNLKTMGESMWKRGFFCHCCVLTRHFFQGSTCSHRCSQGSPTVSVRRIWIGGSGGKRLNLVEDPHGSSSHQWVSILSHDLVRLGWCGGPQV